MPSLQPSYIEQLARAVLTSARQGNWRALQNHDVQVQELMAQLPSDLTADQQLALNKLKGCHRHALRMAEQKREQLQAQLQELRNRNEGLRAYQEAELSR